MVIAGLLLPRWTIGPLDVWQYCHNAPVDPTPAIKISETLDREPTGLGQPSSYELQQIIDVFRFDDRGKIVEQWDVLQRVGHCGKRQAAAVERTGVTWSSRIWLTAREARRHSC